MDVSLDDITAVCNSLGKLDSNDGTYMKDRDCDAGLREISRYLSTDKKHQVRCHLGALNVIRSDLIPLLNQYCDSKNSNLFTIILRICVNLTSPVEILLETQHDETEDLALKTKLTKVLFNFKEAFAIDEEIWSTLNSRLQESLEDEVTFERLIILVRNIFHIPVDATADFGLQPDFDVHDMCLQRMDKSGMLKTFIQIASETTKGTEYCFHLTEVVYLMLRDINPKTIAHAKPYSLKRKLDANDPDKKRLAELTSRDRRLKQGPRGIVVKDLKSYNRFNRNAQFIDRSSRSTLGDNPLLIKDLITDRSMIDLNTCKTDLRKSKNRQPMSSQISMILSDTNTKLTKASHGLQLFCKNFIERVFCNYMQQIKHNLIQKRTQENDETYYFWAIQFFIAFGRHSNFGINYITEILSSSTLHFNRSLITSYLDKLEIEKKKFHDTSRRLHLALRAYKELLYLLKKTKTISSHRSIFDDSEPLILSLFHHYTEPKYSRHYLEDLIETNHIFLDLVEEYEPTRSIERYSSPDVMQVYSAILKDFKTNSDQTNECVLKFFERTVKNENEVILFQASIFRCILDIMDYPLLPAYDRFVQLGKHLFETFGAMANKRRWMFQELLFWKNGSDVFSIKNGIDPPPVCTDTLDIMDRPAADDLSLDDCLEESIENTGERTESHTVSHTEKVTESDSEDDIEKDIENGIEEDLDNDIEEDLDNDLEQYIANSEKSYSASGTVSPKEGHTESPTESQQESPKESQPENFTDNCTDN